MRAGSPGRAALMPIITSGATTVVGAETSSSSDHVAPRERIVPSGAGDGGGVAGSEHAPRSDQHRELPPDGRMVAVTARIPPGIAYSSRIYQ